MNIPRPTLSTLIGLSVLASLAGSGYASIVASGPDRVNVRSEPAGAEVRIDGRHVGTTPVEDLVFWRSVSLGFEYRYRVGEVESDLGRSSDVGGSTFLATLRFYF